MTTLSEFFDPDQINAIARRTIIIGDVYRILMDERNGIKPKPGDTSRKKYFIVLGFDDEGNVYGGVIINSHINKRTPIHVQYMHMPLSCETYTFLEYDSFVDCSSLKCASLNSFRHWQYKGTIKQEDIDLIIETIRTSPIENKAHLAQYGL